MPKALIFLGMLVHDFAVLAGCTWLIVAHGWSLWWYLAALVLMHRYSPRAFFSEAINETVSELKNPAKGEGFTRG